MTGVGYEPAPAARAHRALDLALARWREHAALPFDPPYDDQADLEAFTGPAQAYVVEVLAWMRGLDDYYLGQQAGLTPRPQYEKVRSQLMTVLLAGARFAVNKSLHVLVTPVAMPAVQMRGVGTLGQAPEKPLIPPAIYMWPDLSHLPDNEEHNLKRRDAYASRFSHQPVGSIIDELAAWFATWRT